MKIYIVDTNIIFSAILNINSAVSKFLLAAKPDQITFYTPSFLDKEIERHLPKLIQLSELKEQQIRRISSLLYSEINFIADELIPFEHYKKALFYVKDIDIDDLVIVALTEFLEGTLWTGDLKLYDGLIAKGYQKVVTFKQIQSTN